MNNYQLLSSYLVFTVLSLGIYGCSKPYYTETRLVMGTFAEVTCQDKSAINAALDEIDHVDQIANNFVSSSEISRLNSNGELKASRDMMTLVEDSLKYYRLSEGAFDITVSPVVDIWKKEIKEALDGKVPVSLPSSLDVNTKLRLIGSDKISVNEKASTIKFNQPGMAIDLGGIAKGYAVDRAVERLKKEGITSAFVNLGGNIYCLGKKGNRKWRIAVQNPRDSSRISYPLELENQAVATSGDYEQFFMFGGKRYSHIIDPRTGYPVDNGDISVTIIADTATAADAMSTAVFVLGRVKGEVLARGMAGISDVKIIEQKDLR